MYGKNDKNEIKGHTYSSIYYYVNGLFNFSSLFFSFFSPSWMATSFHLTSFILELRIRTTRITNISIN